MCFLEGSLVLQIWCALGMMRNLPYRPRRSNPPLLGLSEFQHFAIPSFSSSRTLYVRLRSLSKLHTLNVSYRTVYIPVVVFPRVIGDSSYVITWYPPSRDIPRHVIRSATTSSRDREGEGPNASQTWEHPNTERITKEYSFGSFSNTIKTYQN